MIITYTKVIDETPEEYYVRLCERGKDEACVYFSGDHFTGNEPGYVLDGYEYSISGIPERVPQSGKIRRLEYVVWCKEVANEEGPHRREVGCVVLFFRREDKKTDVVAELHHPAFEREFRSIFGGDEQKHGEQPTTKEVKPLYVNEEWYQQLTIQERDRYNFLHPYKEAWESEEITDTDLSAKASVSVSTISRWRRDLRKQKAPDMDWKKKNRGSA